MAEVVHIIRTPHAAACGRAITEDVQACHLRWAGLLATCEACRTALSPPKATVR